MGQPRFEDIQRILRELVFPFYTLERDLTLPIHNHRNETDAEHSWSLALCALMLAPEIDSKLDVGKVTSFAVIHDLVEVYAGDTSVWADQELLDSKSAREAKAIHTLEKKFPMFPSLGELVKSYERKDTEEALFVYALDKFIAMLTLYEDDGYYYKNAKRTEAVSRPVLEKHQQKAHAHPQVAKYYDKLIDLIYANPNYFYKS